MEISYPGRWKPNIGGIVALIATKFSFISCCPAAIIFDFFKRLRNAARSRLQQQISIQNTWGSVWDCQLRRPESLDVSTYNLPAIFTVFPLHEQRRSESTLIDDGGVFPPPLEATAAPQKIYFVFPRDVGVSLKMFRMSAACIIDSAPRF